MGGLIIFTRITDSAFFFISIEGEKLVGGISFIYLFGFGIDDVKALVQETL